MAVKGHSCDFSSPVEFAVKPAENIPPWKKIAEKKNHHIASSAPKCRLLHFHRQQVENLAKDALPESKVGFVNWNPENSGQFCSAIQRKMSVSKF